MKKFVFKKQNKKKLSNMSFWCSKISFIEEKLTFKIKTNKTIIQ